MPPPAEAEPSKNVPAQAALSCAAAFAASNGLIVIGLALAIVAASALGAVAVLCTMAFMNDVEIGLVRGFLIFCGGFACVFVIVPGTCLIGCCLCLGAIAFSPK